MPVSVGMVEVAGEWWMHSTQLLLQVWHPMLAVPTHFDGLQA